MKRILYTFAIVAAVFASPISSRATYIGEQPDLDGANITNIPISSVVGQTETNAGFELRIGAVETNYLQIDYSFLSAISSAQSNIVRIAFIGDSFTYGTGADYEKSYPKKVFRVLTNSTSGFGQAGNGILANNDNVTVSGGGSWEGDISDWAGAVILNFTGASNDVMETTVYGTNLNLYLAKRTVDSTVYCVIDGATNTLNVSTTMTNYSVAMGSLGDHSVSISTSNGVPVTVGGIEGTYATNGFILAQWGLGSHQVSVSGRYISNLRTVKPKAVVIFTGNNEWNAQADTNTFYSNVEAALTNAIANTGAAAALVTIPVGAWVTDSKTIKKSTYNNQIVNLGNAYGVPVVRLDQNWPTNNTTSNNLGLLNSVESYHPSEIGYSVIAQIILRSLFNNGIIP